MPFRPAAISGWGLRQGRMGFCGTGEDRDGRKRIPVCCAPANLLRPDEARRRLAIAGALYETGILVQRLCNPDGFFCRTRDSAVDLRDRGETGKPIHLHGTGASLRAHVLNPAGPQDPPGPGRRKIHQTSTPARSNRGDWQDSTLFSASGVGEAGRLRLLGNSVSEDALVYKPAHAHVHRNAQREEGKQHRRSAITHEG